MTRSVWRLVRTLLMTAIAVGLTLGLIVDRSAGVIAGVGAGTILVTALKNRAVISRRHAGNTSPVRARHDFLVHLGDDEIFTRSFDAFRTLPAMVTRVDLRAHVIEAETKAMGTSWGDRIRIEIRQPTADGTVVTISSQPAFALTIVGSGKKWENVFHVVKALEARPMLVAVA